MDWSERVNVRVAPEQREALMRLAMVQQRSAASLVREAVSRFLSEHETRLHERTTSR